MHTGYCLGTSDDKIKINSPLKGSNCRIASYSQYECYATEYLLFSFAVAEVDVGSGGKECYYEVFVEMGIQKGGGQEPFCFCSLKIHHCIWIGIGIIVPVSGFFRSEVLDFFRG